MWAGWAGSISQAGAEDVISARSGPFRFRFLPLPMDSFVSAVRRATGKDAGSWHGGLTVAVSPIPMPPGDLH